MASELACRTSASATAWWRPCHDRAGTETLTVVAVAGVGDIPRLPLRTAAADRRLARGYPPFGTLASPRFRPAAWRRSGSYAAAGPALPGGIARMVALACGPAIRRLHSRDRLDP